MRTSKGVCGYWRSNAKSVLRQQEQSAVSNATDKSRKLKIDH